MKQKDQSSPFDGDLRTPGDVTAISDSEKPVKELSHLQRPRDVIVVVLKIVLVVFCLYVFICTLGLLEASFQLLGGKTAGNAFSSGLLSNPIAGLMVGVLATVLVQSSSTSTSIVVSMVGSEVIPIRKAVPIIMGANIGTSVTSTLVSLAHVGNRKDFRRAFSGATIHDVFNWLTVLILLPVELATGYLHWLSALVVDSFGMDGNREKAQDMLKAITTPVLKSIVEVNKNIIRETATGSVGHKEKSVLKRWCENRHDPVIKTDNFSTTIVVDCITDVVNSPFLRSPCSQILQNNDLNRRNVTMTLAWETSKEIEGTLKMNRCENLFAHTDLDDDSIGIILLITALILLTVSLLLVVKTLNSMIKGTLVKIVQRTINSDLPGRFACLTGYVAVLIGCGMTIVVQSSSIFTSTLTPLVGVGIISLQRMYPMTLGSNVGTTVTSVLAALSQSGPRLKPSLQIALCHLFFNLSGFLLFYPIPCTRFPIHLSTFLGDVTYKYRWFAIFYLICMFGVLPAFVFALSHAGWQYLLAIGGPVFLSFLILVVINVLQSKKPDVLPVRLRNWEFLPLWCHSFEPIDNLIDKLCPCVFCRKLLSQSAGNGNSDVEEICIKANGDDKLCPCSTDTNENK